MSATSFQVSMRAHLSRSCSARATRPVLLVETTLATAPPRTTIADNRRMSILVLMMKRKGAWQDRGSPPAPTRGPADSYPPTAKWWLPRRRRKGAVAECTNWPTSISFPRCYTSATHLLLPPSFSMPIAITAPDYQQSDESIWKKVNSSLMNVGVPITPIMIRRAHGTVLYVSAVPTAG